MVRKNITVQKGEMVLLEGIKYFFYITNQTDYCVEQVWHLPTSVAIRKT